jgi:hypothetical protein
MSDGESSDACDFAAGRIKLAAFGNYFPKACVHAAVT